MTQLPPLTGPEVQIRRCLFPGRVPNFGISFENVRYEPQSPFGPILLSIPPVEEVYENDGWEVQNVFPNEVAIIAALTIAWPPDYGTLNFYPARYPLKAHLPEGFALQYVDVMRWLFAYLNKAPYSQVSTVMNNSRSADSEASLESTEYPVAEFISYAAYLHGRLENKNTVLLRGLYHMIKAQMLMGYLEFVDSAALELYVAMAATWELFAEELRAAGNTNPGNADVVRRFQELYKVELPGNQYFGDYYTDRIRCLHPVARGEPAVSPPLMVDDVYHLYPDLLRVFEYFVAGSPDEYVARYRFYWNDKSIHAKDELIRYMTLVPNAKFKGSDRL